MSNYLDQPRTLTDEFALVPCATVRFYLAGTETPTPVYASLDLRADDAGDRVFTYGARHPNPMQADSAARLPPVFLDVDVDYRMVMTAPDGSILHDIENFTVFPGPELITPKTDDGAGLPFATLTTYLSQTTEIAIAEQVADVNGVFVTPLALDDDIAYRVALKTQHGELVYDVDPYPGDGSSIAGMGVASGAGDVALTDHQCVSPGVGADVISGYRLGADGVLYEVVNTDGVTNVFTPIADEWLLTSGSFEVRGTVTFGLDPIGTGASPPDVWLPLSSDVNFWMRRSTIAEPDPFGTTMLVEIRAIGDTDILAAASLSFSMDR